MTDCHADLDNVRMTSRGPLVASHPAMREMLSVLDRVASSTCTVLVTGESGTGKELAVAALHDASPRRSARLVAVNCGAIPENLVESELFGHVRGAFTGASTARQGLVAAAEGGTLFLDEIGELSPAVQVKLLRLIQQREYTPVGDTRVVRCDVRIVAATNRDIEREVAEGRFREDLYYRLNVIHVHVPPLRERRDDIRDLAMHFLESAAERTGRTDVVDFSAAAMVKLVADEWPGNVRALENAVERAVLLSPGPVVPAECVATGVRLSPQAPASAGASSSGASRIFPVAAAATATAGDVVDVAPVDAPLDAPLAAPVAAPVAADADVTSLLESAGIIDLRAAVEEYENRLIREALRKCGNNKSRAAQMLKLQRTTFVEMLKRKGIEAFPRAA